MRTHHAFFRIIITTLVVLGLSSPLHAFWGNSDVLVTVNDTEYSPADFRNWWREWREPGMNIPETPDPYIDWLLLSSEAKAMQLDENASYLKKLDVFLKVRSLMQLKAEEIDANKEIPPRDVLWEGYRKEYTPIFDLAMIAVPEQEQAQVVRRFLDEGVAFLDAAEAAGLENVAEELEHTGPMRFTRIPDPLREAIMPLEEGDIAGPVFFGHSYYFIEVLERNEGSDADFETLKQALIRQEQKKQEARLTQALLERLMDKYQVQVDEEAIAAIDPEGVSGEDAEHTVIRIADIKIPASVVYEAVQKAQKTRGQARHDPESFAESKKRVVQDILSQTLTNMEALDRHYEEVPPLKQTFEFYQGHRLIKELEAEIIKPRAEVTDENVKAYYDENPGLFSREGFVEMAMVRTNEAQLAERITRELKTGADFFSVMEPVSPAGVRIEKRPAAHLPDVIKAELEKLSPGQVGIVEDGDETVFIKLVRREDQDRIPFDAVRDRIRTQLEEERFESVRNEMIQQLRALSDIEINQSAWKKLRKTLVEEEV
jgi:hypothetical protein